MPATASVVVITSLSARGQIIIFHGKLKFMWWHRVVQNTKEVKDLHVIHNQCLKHKICSSLGSLLSPFYTFSKFSIIPINYGSVDFRIESKRTWKYTGFDNMINIKFIFLFK